MNDFIEPSVIGQKYIPHKHTWVVYFRQIKSELDHPRILAGNTFPPDDLATDEILLFAQVARFLVRTPKKLD